MSGCHKKWLREDDKIACAPIACSVWGVNKIKIVLTSCCCVHQCSDSEDLFGDYDSLLDDKSLLAKLEQADKMVALGPAGQDCFLANSAVDAPDTDAARENSPPGWHEAKRRKVHTSSTPHGSPEDRKRHGGAMRRSMSERVKKMLRSNATTPAGPSRSAAMKEAALSHEIGGAVRAVEAARADANDLGPFFGLPAKVKDLLFTLRGIRSLYGDTAF